MFNKNVVSRPIGKLKWSSTLRHRRYVKIAKKDYDKKPEILTLMLFNEKFDEKSYKMAIYKSGERVYNKSPE